MRISSCASCRKPLLSRLRARISYLEYLRRGLHVTAPSRTSQKWSHISSQYVDTIPPSDEQLCASSHFFSTHVPTKSWTASEWRKHISQHSDDLNRITPEIAVLGRSNSGKSSLLNALLNNPGLCRVGPRPGKTTIMHAWALSFPEQARGVRKSAVANTEPKLTVLDMPGYGHGSRNEWGQEIIKYMRRRRQLRRAFILLNPKHGIKTSDEQILNVLRTEGIPHQIIACKCDELRSSEFGQRLDELRAQMAKGAFEQNASGLALDDVLAVGGLGDGRANQRVATTGMKGINNVRWAILQASGLEQYASSLYAESLEPEEEKRPLRMVHAVAPSPRSGVASSSI